MSDTALLSPEYNGTKLLKFTAVFIPTQIIAVGLRYLARHVVHGPWGIDDVIVMTSLSLQMCMAGLSIGSVYHAGVGYHVAYLEETHPATVILWGKYLVAISVLYFGSVNIPKVAILALYYRLFPNKQIRQTVRITIGILIALTVATVTSGLSSCRPFAANWNPKLPGAYCINKEAFFRYGSIPNTLTDVVILVIPVRTVWNLHTSTRLRIGLIVTFMVGGFGLVTSIIRFTTFFEKNSFVDGTWSAVDLIIWTQVETGVYLISACLMTYRPLLERARGRKLIEKLAGRSSTSNTNSGKPKSTGQQATDIPMKPRAEKKTDGFYLLMNDDSLDHRITGTTDISIQQEPIKV